MTTRKRRSGSATTGTVLHVRLDHDLRTRLNAFAMAHGITSQSEAVRAAIRLGVGQGGRAAGYSEGRIEGIIQFKQALAQALSGDDPRVLD